MKRYILEVTILGILALSLSSGCLVSKASRKSDFIQRGQYTNIVSSLTLPKSSLIQVIGLALDDADYENPPPRTLKGSELTVWMKNLSEEIVRVSPALGGRSIQLQHRIRTRVWSGTLEEDYFRYPLINCHVRETSKVELELEFNPPVELTNNLAITIVKRDAL